MCCLVVMVVGWPVSSHSNSISSSSKVLLGLVAQSPTPTTSAFVRPGLAGGKEECHANWQTWIFVCLLFVCVANLHHTFSRPDQTGCFVPSRHNVYTNFMVLYEAIKAIFLQLLLLLEDLQHIAFTVVAMLDTIVYPLSHFLRQSLSYFRLLLWLFKACQKKRASVRSFVHFVLQLSAPLSLGVVLFASFYHKFRFAICRKTPHTTDLV